MAKIAFSKLGLKVNTQVNTFEFGDYIIEVRSYLPITERAEMISKIINKSSDDNGFYNPLRVQVQLYLEVVYNYTNLTFTEKQKENEAKLYDCLVSSGLFEKIISVIPDNEWQDLQDTVWQVIENIYNYKNSAAGIIDVIASNYSSVNFDLDSIQKKIADPDQMTLLKEIAPLINNVTQAQI